MDFVECTSMVFHSSAKNCKNDGTRKKGPRVQCNEFGDETNQRLFEPGTSAKLVDTSMGLVGDDFCVAARQKQMQNRCELSMWEILICERDDRLVIKQFPYSPRQGMLPRYDHHLCSDSGCWKNCGEIVTQSSFDGAEHE